MTPTTAVQLGGFAVSAVIAGLCGGCLETLIEKSYYEVRGGRGSVLPVVALPEGKPLNRFAATKIAPVFASVDANVIPLSFSRQLTTQLAKAIADSRLFPLPGDRGQLSGMAGQAPPVGPVLEIRVRVTTYWPQTGIVDSALGPFSEVLGLVEFVDESAGVAIGRYYVRGYSKAVARRGDDDLASGMVSAIMDVVSDHRDRPR